MKKILLSLVAVCVVFGANAQTRVEKYDGRQVAEGVVYALPRTEVQVKVVAEKIVSYPGMFYKYAERFLAANDFVQTESVEWRLKSVEIDGRVVADEMRRFQVMPNKKNAAGIRLSAEGVILGIGDCDVVDTEKKMTVRQTDERDCGVQFHTDLLGEEVLMSTSIPKMAEMTAKQIYRIREGRMALLTCEVEKMPDGDAVKALLKRLDREERELVALFVGKTMRVEETRVYTVKIDHDLTNSVVARLSVTEGLLDADNVIGEPIYMNVKGWYPTEPAVMEKGAKPSEGFAYVVPGSAKIDVTCSGKIVAEKELVMPQFGYVARLSTVFTDRQDATVKFSKESGRIVEVK